MSRSSRPSADLTTADDPMLNGKVLNEGALNDGPSQGGEAWQVTNVDRRRFLAGLSALGLASPLFGEALWAQVADESVPVTAEQVRVAAQVAGLEFTDSELELMMNGVRQQYESYKKLRAVKLPNSVPPALHFRPWTSVPSMPGGLGEAGPSTPEGLPKGGGLPGDVLAKDDGVERPDSDDELAFLSVHELASLVRRQLVTSVELTELYLRRLERFDPLLHCVVTLLPERALEQARAADAEISAGRWRGPLHGIPWGAKDLLSVAGAPTTWGAQPYREQRIEHDAMAVRRMDAAGAVLLGKLTLGALAWGDVWFGGTTRNPWNPEQGSSGSSAGSASATAAGLVGFSLGSETWGSIVSPSTRCGASGLRPSFGRVSRDGAMTLSWSMDKLGPICRSAEDCALVFAQLHGTNVDDGDPMVIDRPFAWPPPRPLKQLRVGYLPALFERQPGEGDDAVWMRHDLEAMDVLRGLGIELQPLELPDELPLDALGIILSAEAAAAFDAFTREGLDDQLVRQEEFAWPNFFRQARTIPAVEYVNANRVRTLVMREWERRLGELDAYVVPSFGGDHLLMTNLTGHPAVVMPNGFRDDGTPTSITFMGRLFDETSVLTLAQAYQQATDFHRRRPPLKLPSTPPAPDA